MNIGPARASVPNSSVDGRLEIRVIPGPSCIPALYFMSFILLPRAACLFLGLYAFEIEWLWGITLTTLVDAPIGVDM